MSQARDVQLLLAGWLAGRLLERGGDFLRVLCVGRDPAVAPGFLVTFASGPVLRVEVHVAREGPPGGAAGEADEPASVQTTGGPAMPCPTCQHTLQRLSEQPPYFWCPRCGSLLGPTLGEDVRDVAVPRLVQHVRRGREVQVCHTEPRPLGSFTLDGWCWRAACEAAGVPF